MEVALNFSLDEVLQYESLDEKTKQMVILAITIASQTPKRYEVFAKSVLIENTYAQEENLNEKGKVDYTKLKPILFEFSNYTYLKTGETVGNYLKLEKERKDENE